MVIGLSKLEVERVIQQVERGVGWVFDGATLHVVEAERLETPPLTSRGRAVLDELGEVYLGYFAGPPRPLYLALSGVKLADPQEFRLAALFFEHLLAALEAAGYRGELERQARTDWLTRLDNRHVFERELVKVSSGSALGVLELDNLQVPGERRSSAENDLAIKSFGEALKEALPKAGRAFRVGGATFAAILPEGERAALEAALRDHTHSAGWAAAAEAQGGELFERADSRMLERKREKFGTSPRPAERVRLEPPSRSLVQVHSGFEQMKLAFQETALTWEITAPVHLILDGPYGYALDRFSDALRPALIVTDSPSPAYVQDLINLKPEGLAVGQTDESRLFEALERVLRGETFYQGPVLPEDPLFPREREVWHLVVKGLDNTQIAAQLGVSEKTVANYVTNLRDKLNLNNRVELVLSYLGKLDAPVIDG